MMRAASDARPVSRILYGVAAADGHSSRPFIAERLKRPTRKFGAPSRHAFADIAIRKFLPYLVLLRVGFAMPRALLFERNGSHRPLTPACKAVYFLWHFPSSRSSAAPKRATRAPSRTLSGTLLCGVRTFLSLCRAARETPASAAQTATIRSDISYPYYKMN